MVEDYTIIEGFVHDNEKTLHGSGEFYVFDCTFVYVSDMEDNPVLYVMTQLVDRVGSFIFDIVTKVFQILEKQKMLVPMFSQSLRGKTLQK